MIKNKKNIIKNNREVFEMIFGRKIIEKTLNILTGLSNKNLFKPINCLKANGSRKKTKLILPNKGKDESDKKGIYFLQKNSKIIYIGIAGVRENQKGSLGKRLHNHYPKSERDKNKINFLSNADTLIKNISISKILPNLLERKEYQDLRKRIEYFGFEIQRFIPCIYIWLNSSATKGGCKIKKEKTEKILECLNKNILKENLNVKLKKFFRDVEVAWFTLARYRNWRNRLKDLERIFILIFNPEYNK